MLFKKMKFCITFLFYVFLSDNATVGHNWADVFLQQTFRPLQKVKKMDIVIIVNSNHMYPYAFGQVNTNFLDGLSFCFCTCNSGWDMF